MCFIHFTMKKEAAEVLPFQVRTRVRGPENFM